MIDTARQDFAVARGRPMARVLLASSFLIGLASKAFDWLWAKHLINIGSRATVISVREHVTSSGEIGGGPPLGWIGSGYGVRAALVASAPDIASGRHLHACFPPAGSRQRRTERALHRQAPPTIE